MSICWVNWCRLPLASGASSCATHWAAGSTARAFGGAFDVQRRAEEVPVDEYLALLQSLDEKKPEQVRLEMGGRQQSTG
jgi:hypothetical protein